ncbi:MAG: hypothetical protein ACI8UO_001084 [Verrucomicrobiales bacterium]|jgi:hypothetical protein
MSIDSQNAASSKPKEVGPDSNDFTRRGKQIAPLKIPGCAAADFADSGLAEGEFAPGYVKILGNHDNRIGLQLRQFHSRKFGGLARVDAVGIDNDPIARDTFSDEIIAHHNCLVMPFLSDSPADQQLLNAALAEELLAVIETRSEVVRNDSTRVDFPTKNHSDFARTSVVVQAIDEDPGQRGEADREKPEQTPSNCAIFWHGSDTKESQTVFRKSQTHNSASALDARLNLAKVGRPCA